MSFFNLYQHGFARVASITPVVHLANPDANATEIISLARTAATNHAAVIAFPELCVSGYSLDDLFFSEHLLSETARAIARIATETADLPALIVVGAPLRADGKLFNCALVLHRGQLISVTPKYNLPNYREFYEQRYFTTGAITPAPGQIEFLAQAFQEAAATAGTSFNDREIPWGQNLVEVSDIPGLRIGIEICEDMWVPINPGAQQALAGATLIVNPSASPITVGRARDRRQLVAAASARYLCAYLYTAAGWGESSTDLSWDGQSLIYENGQCLAESERFATSATITYADIDIARLRGERAKQTTFANCSTSAQQRFGFTRLAAGTGNSPVQQQLPACAPAVAGAPTQTGVTFVHCGIDLDTEIALARPVDRFPFVPDDPTQLDQDCYEAFNIQVSALMRRMAAIGAPKIVIGVSGGLDSTHALLVAAQAMDRLNRPRTDILAYTMPGFATSDHTKSNAYQLCAALGVSFEELDIRPAAEQMLAGLHHPYARGEEVYDVTFENVQAGLRTDYLFRLANHHSGIVLGTGDLSELALGWCTYGVGDQMSHYAVNAGIPKTLMQHLIRWVVAKNLFGEAAGKTLISILNTEISPELIPAKDGEVQSTESSIGPYALHDFTLYHLLRYGAEPARIAYLAWNAWHDIDAGHWPVGYPDADRKAYDMPTILKWLRSFYWRFFTNQFKRTAIPNGPKVMAGGSLSPRGDWRMPADALQKAWIECVAKLQEQFPAQQ